MGIQSGYYMNCRTNNCIAEATRYFDFIMDLSGGLAQAYCALVMIMEMSLREEI